MSLIRIDSIFPVFNKVFSVEHEIFIGLKMKNRNQAEYSECRGENENPCFWGRKNDFSQNKNPHIPPKKRDARVFKSALNRCFILCLSVLLYQAF